ncbi:MAG: aspartate oxidase, partial [Thermoleophilia bacterium]
MTPRSPGRFDLIVIGGGVAGLYAALCAAAEGDVLVLSKGPLPGSASYLAQGGVAAAVGEGDSPALHAKDTIAAGRGLCRASAVRVLTEEAPARVRDLVELGVPFDAEPELEGGHSRPRVLHVGGATTGREILRVLVQRARQHPRIEIREGERALALLVGEGGCRGVITDRGRVLGRATLLASGGYAALWERTTNPPGSVGDGLTLAFRAGAALADLELVQFHPTAVAGSGLLLSEALRGAGAVLLDAQGRRFTDELAPRDVVARAICEREVALLDLRPVDRDRFPALMGALEAIGYDPSSEPIPVSPAAHYTMGGIVTDLDGRTELPGLYAAGECACTGVHGANRLASNSLLECLVFGRRAALAALAEPDRPSHDRGQAPAVPSEEVAVTPELRRA